MISAKSTTIPGKKLRYGIIGCGYSAQKHAKSLAKNQHSILAAVFDINPVRAKNMAARYNCEEKPTLEAILTDPAIDVLVICTPHDIHKKLILKTIESGKYCITEKPLGMNSKECRQILKSKHYHKNVFMVQQVRFNASIQFLFDAVNSGALGILRFCSATVRKNREDAYFENNWKGKKKKVGGMLFNQGAHAIDLMAKLCGEPKKVAGMAKRFRAVSELEDLYVGIIEFKSGALGALEVTTYARPRNLGSSIFVIGDRGTIRIGGHTFDKIEYVNVSGGGKVLPKIPRVQATSHEKFLESVNDFVLRKKAHPLLPFAEDGARAVEFTEKLYQNVI